MTQPEELERNEPLAWSTGTGIDVWNLFCACISGDLATVQRLLAKDPSLVRCHYSYCKPLYFAVRENRLAVAEFLLHRDPDPIGLAVNDSLLEIARDRGYAEMATLLERKLATLHNVSSKGEAVAEAIRQRDASKAESLLDASPELLHAGDQRSNQPIHWAVMTRQLDIIDKLLARGAEIHAKRCDGARPIQLANGDYHFRGWDRQRTPSQEASLRVRNPNRHKPAAVVRRTTGTHHSMPLCRFGRGGNPASRNLASVLATSYGTRRSSIEASERS